MTSVPAPIRRIAESLGVEDARDPGLWLKRLWLLQPAAARPWPRWLIGLVRALARLLDAGLSAVDAVLSIPLGLLSRGGKALLNHPAHRRLWARLESRTQTSEPLSTPGVFVLATVAAIGFVFALSTPLTWPQQTLLFGLLWLMAMTVREMPGQAPTLLMVGLSLVASGRYIWWRCTATLDFEKPIEHVLGYGLLLAEAYTWLILLLGYVQNAFPLRRPSVPLPEDRSLWPAVDVFIPTYNEPLWVVKRGVYAALGMDWPEGKLKVFLLDDGRRPEFRQFAEAVGVRYLTRPDNAHAKAGNLNHALKHSHGEFVTIFDCDHIPVRTFLTATMGWFLRDPKCAMVQTPHHFFSADPFERNLGTFRRLPNEGDLFYGLVQDGNDLWNATFFCGSCAVLRRGPLEEVGGVAIETVTEDAHTALKLHRRGYNTAYLGTVLAAGLSTESLSGHVNQRVRWARGMTQIFRTDNPFLGRGLSLFQRLCYSSSMLHFLNGVPRLVFLTAPLAFLFFELHVIQAAALMIAAYALPHLVLAQITNSRMQGRYRYSFWAEIYETVLAWYIALPAATALVNPRLGKFNVTSKGGLIEHSYFDFRIARPYLVLIAVNALGVALGLMHLFVWGTSDVGTLVMNLCWAIFNLVMLGTAAGVATEQRQVRQTHRVPLTVPATLCLPDGRRLSGTTSDYSSGGVGVELQVDSPLRRGDAVDIELEDAGRVLRFPARVALWIPPRLGLRFAPMSVQQEQQWIAATFGRPDNWLHSKRDAARDRPLGSLVLMLRYSAYGFASLVRALIYRDLDTQRQGLRLPVTR